MKPILVLYATREGHTQKVAERVARVLGEQGFDVALHDVREVGAPNWENYQAAILAASIHVGRHEREMVQFVKRRRAELERLPTAFLSVSMAEADAENVARDAAIREQAEADVEKAIEKFIADTGWTPGETRAVAGALPYTKLNFIVRFLLRRIVETKGGPTDTSHDYVFTDWPALDRFATSFAEHLRGGAAKPHVGEADRSHDSITNRARH